jgi:hypothetical protein
VANSPYKVQSFPEFQQELPTSRMFSIGGVERPQNPKILPEFPNPAIDSMKFIFITASRTFVSIVK